MPTASQGASSTRKGPGGASPTAPTARPSAAPLPPATRRAGHARQSPTHTAVSPRGATTPTKLLPVRRDSSIGATSTNPRLRHGSVMEAAAVRRSSSAPRPNVDFHAPESKAALRTLRVLFLPVVVRAVLRRRRRAHWKHGEPPRRYTVDSVVSAIAGSKTMLAEWPLRVLEQLADDATFHYLGPKEFIVYAHESHVSCGIVVLLYGQLEERRPDTAAKQKNSITSASTAPNGNGSTTTGSRPIRTQTHRLHKAMDVLCVMPVLCEDLTTSAFATRDKEAADVAVISSRWFWEVYYNVVQSSLPASDVLTRYMKDVVAPHRRDIVMADYFPTSVVLLRSWMWPLLTASDRVKLCRAMEVRVLGVGEVLFDEGDYCPYIYIVRRGTLTVIVKGEALGVLEAGACLGEESVLFHEKRNSSVVGSTICELYALHVQHLEHRLTKYPEVGEKIIAAAVARQQRWMEEGKTRDVFGLVSILSGVPCLGHSTDAMREQLAQCATVRTVPRGHVLATVNTPCTSLFVVGRGSVVLSSVVKPASTASPSASITNVVESVRPGSARGRSGSPSSKRRPSSSVAAKSTANPRTSIAGVAPLSPQEVNASVPEVRREVRSAGDFLGELCLKPHLWPVDVTCETTVAVWQLDREAILRVLEQNRADAQAMEVCRQGISLYRAQRGEASLIEGFDAPTSPVAPNGRRPSVAARRGSRAPSSQGPSWRRSSSTLVAPPPPPMPSPTPRTSVSLLGKAEDSLVADASVKSRSLHGGGGAAVEWTPEQWTDYALTRLQEGLAEEKAGGDSSKDGATAAAAAPSRELRPVDKEVEKAMKEKVLQLIAVQPSTPPNPADCDISGDGEELQAIIVEQLFLIPTERQPRFIRQVNDSNVRLVTENDEPAAVLPAEVQLEEDELRDPWQSGGAPISVSGVMRLEDVNAAAVEEAQQMRLLTSYSFQGTNNVTVDSGAIIRSLGENMELSGQVTLPPALGRSRRSASVAALEDSGASFMASFPARNSVSRSHFVRPPSGLPISPRSNVRGDLLSPRGMSVVRPSSSSEPRVAPPTRTRPTSVDYNQFNKVGTERSTSALDRYVKIEDQNYFDNYVKVLPLQQDEIWAPDEVVVEDEISGSSLVLLLLHVRRCDYLVPAVMAQCARPIVKVTLGQRVLVRTPVMRDVAAPHWPIEESSFITFVRRGTEVVFAVCDAEDESNVVYRCTLPTAAIHENGGVGQQAMTLTEVAETADGDAGGGTVPPSTETEEGMEPSTASLNKESRKTPCLSTTMLAVTATKYKALRQALKTDKEKEKQQQLGSTTAAAAGTFAPDTTTLFLQVMSVEGLRHRIEASVTVSFYNGGTVRQLLETSQVLPKTRSPAWPAETAFAKVCGEGGVLTFNLQHKGAVISSAEAAVDELVFGGVGLRRLPLLQAQTGNAVMGHLVLGVLGASLAGGKESRSRDWVTHLTVEELRLSQDGFAITPDPFVLLRDGAGTAHLRTPLACGTFEASWSAAEASCLLPCPRLSGSTTAYHLEVCDSDAREVVGRATLTVAERGLIGGSTREIALDPPGIGTVRVRSLCQPLLELPERGKHGPLVGATVTSTTSLPALPDDATAVLLVHVGGCDDLPGGTAAAFQTDAVATVAVDGQRCLRTPIREGTTAPRWSLSKASVLLRLPAHSVAQLQLQPGGNNHHECVFAVYDGVVDEVNQIGQVAVPLEQLLSSALHSFPLFSTCRDSAGNASNAFATPTMPTPPDAALGRGAARTVGTVHVQTLFGRLNQQVDPVGAVDAETETAVAAAATATTQDVPYYNPDGGAAAVFPSSAIVPSSAAAAASSTTAGTVLLGVSNVCHVLPNASAKYIHLTVHQGATTVLSVERAMGVSSHAEWNVTESSAALARESLVADATLVVELHAMDVVEGKVEDAQEEEPIAAAAVAPSSATTTPTLRQGTSFPVERVLLGRAVLPAARLVAVGAGQVDVVSLQLEGGPSNRPQSKGVAGVSAEGKPTVSFCIVGNRA